MFEIDAKIVIENLLHEKSEHNPINSVQSVILTPEYWNSSTSFGTPQSERLTNNGNGSTRKYMPKVFVDEKVDDPIIMPLQVQEIANRAGNGKPINQTFGEWTIEKGDYFFAEDKSSVWDILERDWTELTMNIIKTGFYFLLLTSVALLTSFFIANFFNIK